jgi:hypothetical protein
MLDNLIVIDHFRWSLPSCYLLEAHIELLSFDSPRTSLTLR